MTSHVEPDPTRLAMSGHNMSLARHASADKPNRPASTQPTADVPFRPINNPLPTTRPAP